MHVLVVDDNRGDRLLVKTYVESSLKSIKIDEAADFDEALEKISQRKYDCLILDYRLPGKSGLELLEHIYDEGEKLGPCPIILLTGIGQENVMLDAYRYGAQEYLYKDALSEDVIAIALRKAQNIYELTRANNEAQKQLFHTQKMESIGRLAGGIAHDFNNMLAIILGNTQLLDNALNQPELDAEKLQKRIAPILRTTQSGKMLVKKLMYFAHEADDERQVLDLNAVFKEVESLCTSILSETVELRLDLTEDLGRIEADPVQVEQAILNLVINAKDAMPGGGVLKLSTQNVHIDEQSPIPLTESLKAGEYVLLCIEDSGTGVPESIKDKIFDPFFTTKTMHEGSGLGLSIVYGFIHAQEGAVFIEDVEPQGARFKLYLPRCFKDLTQSNKAILTDNLDYAGQGQRIVVVEDEPELLNVISITLRNNGYEVLPAQNAASALSLIEEDPHVIDLIVSDIVMPGTLSGVELLSQARERWPHIKGVLMTGYAPKDIPQYKSIKNQFKIIKKPFKDNELLKEVSQCFKA